MIPSRASAGSTPPGTWTASGPAEQLDTQTLARDPQQREQYVSLALAHIPRLLGSIDRNPFRPTYGCLDRQYWHYRTSSFPSEMYQEGVWPLALVYATALPGNRWHGQPTVRALAVAALRFAARSSHPDGSCDDYYPFERALGAAVFSFCAAVRACQLLGLRDPEIREWLDQRAGWIMGHGESGRLANHHALAALGLLWLAELTGQTNYHDAGQQRLQMLLGWQSPEGWFDEYGGADPGYQTLTIDCLAQCRRLLGGSWLDGPIARAVAFARLFLHPDGSFGGEYGSRGTYHFFPHGMELLAGHSADAADLADGFLGSLQAGSVAEFSDDRMYMHRLGNLIEAYLDWSPVRPPAPPAATEPKLQWLSHAGLLVWRHGGNHTVVSAARGGVLKHFVEGRHVVSDAGLVVQTRDGRIALSQAHDQARQVAFWPSPPESLSDSHGVGQPAWRLKVAGPLHWVRFETATPLKQAVFHLGMCLAGRWCRTAVRALLQRRLITGRRPSPIRLERCVEVFCREGQRPRLRITDTIELMSRAVHVTRMGFGVDHFSAYVAASGVYQQSVLAPWTELDAYVEPLNRHRQVTIVREF